MFFKSKQTNRVNIGFFFTLMGFSRIECATNLFVGIEIHGIHLNQIRYWWDCLSLRLKIFVFRAYDFFLQNVYHVHPFLWFPCWPPNPKLSWSHPQNDTLDFLLASESPLFLSYQSWMLLSDYSSKNTVFIALFFNLVTCNNFLYPHKSTSNSWAKKTLLLIIFSHSGFQLCTPECTLLQSLHPRVSLVLTVSLRYPYLHTTGSRVWFVLGWD